MKRSWIILVILLVGLALAAPAAAQTGNRDYDKAFGLGFGLVDLESGAETYLTVSARFRIAGPKAGSGGNRAGSMKGYVEPEIGWVEEDDDVFGFDRSTEDLLVGINLVGVVPYGSVDFFFGGGAGLHFVDLQSDLSGIDESDEHLGLNFHAGLDVHVNDSVSLYVVGRFDLVEDFEDEEQAKIIVGVRFNFD